MSCQFRRNVGLLRFDQGSYLEIQDAQTPSFFLQLQLDLGIGELRAQRHEAILAECSQPAATEPVRMLNEEQALLSIARVRQRRLDQSRVGADDAARQQVWIRESVLLSNSGVHEVVMVRLPNGAQPSWLPESQHLAKGCDSRNRDISGLV